jgi:hypothetical protein
MMHKAIMTNGVYMKRLMIMILGCWWGSVFAIGLPAKATINFTLTDIERGESCPALLKNAKVVVDYDYNFERNMGLAHLRKLVSASWVESLFPLGLSNYYAFMSDMKPKTIQLDNGEVTVFRIIFHLYKNGDTRLYMMLNEDGDCIMSSDVINVIQSY